MIDYSRSFRNSVFIMCKFAVEYTDFSIVPRILKWYRLVEAVETAS